MPVSAAQSGSDGYLTSPSYDLATDGYALTAEALRVEGPAPAQWVPWLGDLDVRVEAESVDGTPVFLGLAPRADVDAYPERLSRGLVLVKWWLLALPHYIVVALLAGGGWTWTVEREWGSAGRWAAGSSGCSSSWPASSCW